MLTDIHEPAPGGAGRRSRRRPADPGISLAARPTCWSPRPEPAASVNIKKGQFLAPDGHAGTRSTKVTSAGNAQVIVTERGTSFGYHDLVVDMRALPHACERSASRWCSTSRTACSSRAAATASRPDWPQYIETARVGRRRGRR